MKDMLSKKQPLRVGSDVSLTSRLCFAPRGTVCALYMGAFLLSVVLLR